MAGRAAQRALRTPSPQPGAGGPRGRPPGARRGIVEVAPGARGEGRPRGPAGAEAALAAADVDDGRGARLGQQVVEGTLEAGHEPAHDGVARAVLVEGVAGRDRLGDAHTSSASRSPAWAPVVGRWPVSRAPGS